MPTFESPDPGIIDRPYVSQIPLDTLFKGLAYKQQEYDQNYQALQGEVDQLDSIQGYGPDAEAAAKVKEAFNSQLGQFKGANLMDPTVRARLNELSSKTSQALLPIARRTALNDKMEEEKKVATEKGRKYFNRGKRDLDQYYASGSYDPNFMPVSRPGLAPDMDKIVTTVHTIVTPDETQVPDPTHPGEYKTVKTWPVDKLTAATKGLLEADPDYDAFMQMNFDDELGSTKWENYAANMVDAANALKARAHLAGNKAIEAEADKGIATYSQLVGKPYGATIAKQLAYRDYKDSHIDDYATGMKATQDGPNLMHKYNELNQQLSNDLTKMREEYRLKGILEDNKVGLKGLTGALLMDNFQDAIDGETGVSTETHIFSTDKEWSDKIPITGAELESSFGITNATTRAAGHNWTPINMVPEAISKVLSKQTFYNGMGVAVTQHKVATDDKGNPLIFKSDDGRTIGYVENVVDVQGNSISKQFNTMNINQARAYATIGTSVAAQQGVQAWTPEDYRKRKGAQAPVPGAIQAPRAANQAEFDSIWKTLQPGQQLIAPNDTLYTK